ncbi:MAG: DUF402 domain-containing protein, partial [Thermoprotei archaeon]
MIRVRVRGIAATAVSKILIDKGHRIVQASSIIRERFGLENNTAPADVTVKDAGEDELLVLGFYGKADRIYEDLVDALEYVYSWISPVGLYSIHRGFVREKRNSECIVDIGVLKGVLPNCRNRPGDKVLVSVERAAIKPGETPRLSYRLRIVGEYLSLVYGSSSITFSEHIRDKSKREFLLAVAAPKLAGSGLGIHFRSSSMYATREDIEREIDLLKNKLKEILSNLQSGDAPQQIYEGEFIGIIGLTSTAKERLDHYRDLVVPTMPRHHSFKTVGGVFSELVDIVEKILAYKHELKEVLQGAIMDYVIEKYKNMPRIRIIHKKPDGKTVELNPGYLYSVDKIGNSYRIIVVRTIRSEGIYDGLNIEKKPGDLDYMVVWSDKWAISHNYHREGKWIGSYININTPPELLPNMIKYHDLLLDVVIKPGEKPALVDLEQFNSYCEMGIFSNKLCDTVNNI